MNYIYIYLDLQNANAWPISKSTEYRQYRPKIMDPILPTLSSCGVLGHHFTHFGDVCVYIYICITCVYVYV